jgi:hypothetical protein
MKTTLVTLGAVGLLGAGVAIHHSGHCPLMEAKKALTHQAPAAVSTTPVVSAVSAVKANAAVLSSAKDAAR